MTQSLGERIVYSKIHFTALKKTNEKDESKQGYTGNQIGRSDSAPYRKSLMTPRSEIKRAKQLRGLIRRADGKIDHPKGNIMI